MSGTIIKNCDCKHKYQDKKYGKGNRVHNLGTGQPPAKKCTVCGKKS